MMTLAEFEKMLDTATPVVPFSAAERAGFLAMGQETGTVEQPSAQEMQRRKQLVADAMQLVAPKAAVAASEGEAGDTPVEKMRGQLAPGTRKRFVLAGSAIFTLRSKATGTRFTYKVSMSDPTKCRPGQLPVYFVSLLNGENNTSDYQYMGTIFGDGFRITRKSRVAADAPSAVAFSWFAKRWEDARVEVWHEGRCGRCGRTLTVPESIESGLGPICASK